MAVRIVSVVKGSDELGYGFTVTGERPAVLTAIQQGSAADRAGLTAGDLVLEINAQNVEEASHEQIVALVGRTRNAIQLIIVSNAELSRDTSIAAVVEREQALQMSYYSTRQRGGAASSTTSAGPGYELPAASSGAHPHPAVGTTIAGDGGEQAYLQEQRLQPGAAAMAAGRMSVSSTGSAAGGGLLEAGAGGDMRAQHDSSAGITSSSASAAGAGGVGAAVTADYRAQQPVASADNGGGVRSRSHSFQQIDNAPRRRNSHLQAMSNGLMPPPAQQSLGGGGADGEPGGEVWKGQAPPSSSAAAAAAMYTSNIAGSSPSTVSRQSLPRSASEYTAPRSAGAGVGGALAAPTDHHRSHDTASISSDVSQGSQLAGAERHVYPVQVAYFGSVAMKGDLSEQAERLRVTRDCVSECRKQHRRPQTVTMHISQKGIRLVWTANGVSETLFVSRSAVALTWVDPSDHRVFSLVQRERVYNGSVSSASGRGGASDKTMVQMKGHVFKVLPNVFDSFQPDGPSPQPTTDGSSSHSAWPIIRLLKYMYGGKSDRKSSRSTSESSFASMGRAAMEASGGGVGGGGGGGDSRRSSGGSPAMLLHHQQHAGVASPLEPMLEVDHSGGSKHGGSGKSGSLTRSTTASALERRGSPESFHSNTATGITFVSPTRSQHHHLSKDSDDLVTMQEQLRLGHPNFSSTPQRAPHPAHAYNGERAHHAWHGGERHDTGGDSHYSPQAPRRPSALGNRSGSLDSVYDASSGSHKEAVSSPQKSNRVASWAANFQTLLADPYGIDLFQDYLQVSFCDENLLFWLAVERYKTIGDAEEMGRVGLEIYIEYIAETAARQVNVESRIYRQLKEAKTTGFAEHTFDAAQREVFNLMKTDSHHKFVIHDIYKQCLYLELDGKPLPDRACRTGSNVSTDSATDPSHNRHLSTKRKGKNSERKNIFGFLKKDKKEKLSEEVVAMRTNKPDAALPNQGKAMTLSKANRLSANSNMYDQMGSVKSAKWSESLPWRKHSTGVPKQRSRLEVRVTPVDSAGGEQNNSFVSSSSTKVVAPLESIVRRESGSADDGVKKTIQQASGDVLFRVTLPDSVSSTVARAGPDVRLQDAVRSIAQRKGLLVDSVEFYEVFDDGAEKMLASSTPVGQLVTNNVHIRLVPLINVQMPSGVIEYCRANKDKSVEDVLMEQLTHYRLTPEAISIFLEHKAGVREPVDPNTGSLSMADRQLVVDITNPAAMLPAEPASTPTSPAPTLSPSGSVKRVSSFKFPFSRRRSLARMQRYQPDGSGELSISAGTITDGTQTLPKGFRTSSSSSLGSFSSERRASTSSTTSDGTTRESSPTKRRVSTVSIAEELADPASPAANDLFNMLDRMQSTRLDNQRDSSLSLRKSPMNGSMATIPTSPVSQGPTYHHSKSASVTYGSLPRGFQTSSPDSGFTNSPSMSGRSMLSPSPQPSEFSDRVSVASTRRSSDENSLQRRASVAVKRQLSDEGDPAPPLSSQAKTVQSGYHSLERKPRSNSLVPMAELRRASSVANVDSPQRPSSLDRRLRNKLSALKPRGKDMPASNLTSEDGTSQERVRASSTSSSAERERSSSITDSGDRTNEKGAAPRSRPSSGKAGARPDHVEDFFRSFNPRVRSMV